MSYLLGIDLGTSSVKALIMSEVGKVLAVKSEEYDVQKPSSDFAEQSPELWWQKTASAIRKALTEAAISADEIAGIGFSGQMHGLVALDKEGKSVCPAIIWLDQRSVQEVREVNEIAKDFIDTQLLNKPSAGMLLCSLLWLKKHKKDLYDKISVVMLPKDYIRYRLTLEIGTEESDASATLAFSLKERRWCNEMIERLGLDTRLFPKVSKSIDTAGFVCESAAKETGLSTKTRVVFGAGDAACQLIGNGIVKEGYVSCNIGTSAQIAVSLNSLVFDKNKQLQTWVHAIPEHYYMQGGALNGGFTLKWLKKQILGDERSYEELCSDAENVASGSEGLIFLPYLSGERTPVMDPFARGVFFGLSAKHTKAHIIRATMEGVIHNLFECALIFERLDVKKEKIIASGGAARGRLWKQIQADIFQMPVYTTKSEEQAGLGSAILAGVGSGIFKSVEEACEIIVRDDTEAIFPIEKNFRVYSEHQQIFRRLYEQTKDLFERL